LSEHLRKSVDKRPQMRRGRRGRPRHDCWQASLVVRGWSNDS